MKIVLDQNVYLLESCAGRVAGTRICGAGAGTPTALRAGAGWTCCRAGRARVELAAGAGRARNEKIFLRVNGCWAKARELNQLKNRKTRGCIEVVCQHCA